MSLSSFEKRVQALARDAIHRFPEGRAAISGALRKAGFPTAVLPSATEVSKSAGDPVYTVGDVESVIGSVSADDPLLKGAGKYFYALRDGALPNPKPEPEVRKVWSEHGLQDRARVALEVMASELFVKTQYEPKAPSKAQCVLKAAESPLGRELYKAMTSRCATADEWLAQQADRGASGELVEVAKLLRSSF